MFRSLGVTVVSCAGILHRQIATAFGTFPHLMQKTGTFSEKRSTLSKFRIGRVTCDGAYFGHDWRALAVYRRFSVR